MITVYGMSTHMPNLSFVEQNENRFIGQGASLSRRSDKIEQIIDEEALEIIRICYEEDKKLLTENRSKLNKMAQVLLEKENIDGTIINAILVSRTTH